MYYVLCTPTCDVWDTLGVQAVHHALDNVHLVFDGEVDEVGVHEDVEGRPQLGVVLEEESAGLLHVLGRLDLVRILRLLLLGRRSVLLLEPRIRGGDHPLHCGKPLGLPRPTHHYWREFALK